MLNCKIFTLCEVVMADIGWRIAHLSRRNKIINGMKISRREMQQAEFIFLKPLFLKKETSVEKETT